MGARPQPKAAQYAQGPDGSELLYRLRVSWAETGRACMLSHLEIARYLERVVRRAHLPYAVSHGFSPHMRIAFGSALPVGVGGTDEIFDVFLLEKIPEENALQALRGAAVPDMMPFACAYIDRRATAASVAYPFSTYRVDFDAATPELVVPESVTVTRKKKERTLHVADFLVEGPALQGNSVYFTLESKPTGSLRVDVFVKALFGDSFSAVTAITRVGLSESIASIPPVSGPNN